MLYPHHQTAAKIADNIPYGYAHENSYTYRGVSIPRDCSTCTGCYTAMRPWLQNPRKNGHDFINKLTADCKSSGSYIWYQACAPCILCDWHQGVGYCGYVAPPKKIAEGCDICRHCIIKGVPVHFTGSSVIPINI